MEGIPQNYKDLVGTKQIFSGGLFTHKRSEPESEYDVIDVRWGFPKINSIYEFYIFGKEVLVDD